jgi:hypothetical protein
VSFFGETMQRMLPNVSLSRLRILEQDASSPEGVDGGFVAQPAISRLRMDMLKLYYL